MYTETECPCNLCGSNEHRTLWDKTPREKEGVLKSLVIRDENNKIVHGKVVMCMKCGLVYTNPKMSKESLAEFYASEYRKIYNSYGDQLAHLQVEAWHSNVAFNVLNKHINLRLKDKSKITFLDVGASMLRLCTVMKCALGNLVDSWGVEPTQDNIVFGLEYNTKNNLPIDIHTYNSTIESFDPEVRFDFIACLNALEHMHSPIDILKKIHTLLVDDGILLLAVPNIWGISINKPVDAWLSCAHLYHFTPPTIAFMAMEAGFEIGSVSTTEEEVGEKIYAILRKSSKVEKPIFYKKPNFDLINRYLLYHDVLSELKHDLSIGKFYLEE